MSRLELVDTPLIRNRESLNSIFARVERVVKCAAPEVWTGLGLELDAYRRQAITAARWG
jgi:hypothetical protein